MARNTIECLINGSVGSGSGASNNSKDVKIVEYLFNIIAKVSPPFPENGRCTQDLISTIRRFQSHELKFPHADGRIDPAGKSLKALVEKARTKRPLRSDLNSMSRPYLFGGAWCGGGVGELTNVMAFLGLKKPTAITQNSSGQPHRAIVDSYLKLRGVNATAKENQIKSFISSTGTSGAKLTDNDFQTAATSLGNGISSAIIRAFSEVESGGRSGFGPAGLPVIAFEGHIFRKYSGKKYDSTHPKLSYKYVKKAGPEWKENNKNQQTAWKTLNDAMALDSNAAIMACSWGMFQVMGFNYSSCGYESADRFVAAMKAGEQGQLEAFVLFCKAVPGMIQAIKSKDFVKMATLYPKNSSSPYPLSQSA